MNFLSSDFGALVFGREVLKKFPKAVLNFYVCTTDAKEKAISEQDFWQAGIKKILAEETRFGRVGVFYDRKNVVAQEFVREDFSKFDFRTKETNRAEKTPRVNGFATQVLTKMANEGMADSIEFRRLARKSIRKAKHANCDSLFFCEAIMGEEKTKKILQHLAGTQVRVFVPSDFLVVENETSKKREIKIHTGDEVAFTKKRAETILRTKLEKTVVVEG